MPDGGLSAAEHGLAHSERVEAHLLRVAREEGAAMTLPDLIPKTHAALVMGEVARDAGRETHHAAHGAIFDAYFGRGEDIGREEVLLRAAADVEGLDPGTVAEAWGTGSMEERLHGFRHVAMRLGIDATPAALICNELLVGTRPYEVLSAAVERCLITPADVPAG